jgi:hypothetical protein
MKRVRWTLALLQERSEGAEAGAAAIERAAASINDLRLSSLDEVHELPIPDEYRAAIGRALATLSMPVALSQLPDGDLSRLSMEHLKHYFAGPVGPSRRTSTSRGGWSWSPWLPPLGG